MRRVLQLNFINSLFILGLFLLTIMSFITYRQFQKLEDSNFWINHTYEVIEKANLILLSVLEEDSLLEDSIQKGEDVIIQKLGKTTIITTNQIKLLTVDNISQKKQTDKLGSLIKEKNIHLEKALKQLSPGLIVITKKQTDKIREVIKNIEQEEFRLLSIRNASSYQKLKTTNLMIIILVGLGYFLMVLTFILINYQNNQLKYSELREHELENRYAKIINSSRDLIAALDTDLNFIAFNQAYEKKFNSLFGVKIEVGMNLRDALASYLDREMLLLAWQHALSGKEYSITMLLGKDTTNECFYEITFSSIHDKDNNVVAASHIMRDITERVKLDNLKTEFVSTVSHELRTPLTSIRGSLSLALSDSLCKINDKMRQLLNIASNNCDRLIFLINDLLDIDKLEKSKMQFRLETIDINKVVEEAVLENVTYSEKFLVKIKLETYQKPLCVLADPERLRQVLDNFISNAIKFTSQGDEVKVVVSLQDNKARVEVKDKGEGVPEEFHKMIFQKFAQADSSTTRKHSGTGLGLSISKAIIEKHNGKIGFTSQPYKETIFYFELPLVS